MLKENGQFVFEANGEGNIYVLFNQPFIEQAVNNFKYLIDRFFFGFDYIRLSLYDASKDRLIHGGEIVRTRVIVTDGEILKIWKPYQKVSPSQIRVNILI